MNYTFNLENYRFRRRILKGLIKIITVSVFSTFLLIGYDVKMTGVLIIVLIFGLILFFLIRALFKSSIYYLTKIEFIDNMIYLSVNRFDKEYKIYELDINSTRIQIFELFFPLTRYGRNYKLKFNTKDKKSNKMVTVYAQHKIGDWDINMFKKVYSKYGEIKGVVANTSSFSKYLFFGD